MMKNWKTNVAAIAAAVTTALTLMEIITTGQAVAILAALATFGFAVSTDAK
jgi:hypothetical protein